MENPYCSCKLTRVPTQWSNLEFVTYYGNGPDRDKIKQHEFRWEDGQLKPRFDIILTTPQLITNDHSFFMRFDFDCVVVDEAHSLKNSKSKFFLNMQALQATQLLLLTGTPIQNNAAELYALLNMVCMLLIADPAYSRNPYGEPLLQL